MGKFNKYFTSIFYKTFVKLFQKKVDKAKIDPNDCRNILVIQLGDIEESLSITPILRTLKNKTTAKISVFVNSHTSILFFK